MSESIKPFDPAEYLETEEDIREFLEEATKGTPEEFIHALNTAVRAAGMTEVARKAGVSRASLYKTLSGEGSPKYETVRKIVEALGCRLTVIPDDTARRNEVA